MKSALDVDKAIDAKDGVAESSANGEMLLWEIGRLRTDLFNYDDDLNHWVATYYDDEILNIDGYKETDRIHRVIPAYLRNISTLTGKADPAPNVSNDQTTKAIASENTGRVKALQTLSTAQPPILVASTDLAVIADILSKKDHPYEIAKLVALKLVKNSSISRRTMDDFTIWRWNSFRDWVVWCAKVANIPDVGAKIIASPRSAILNGFKELRQAIEVLAAKDKLTAEGAFSGLTTATFELIRNSFKRAAFELLAEESAAATHNKFLEKKDPAVKDKMSYRTNLMSLQLSAAMGKKSSVWDLFVPVPEMSAEQEYTLGNVFIYEARLAIATNKRVNYGAKAANINPRNYHFYESAPMASIDVASDVKIPLFVSIKKEVPTIFFCGIDESEVKEIGTEATFQSGLIVHAGKHDNDFSAILAIKKVFETYCPTKIDTLTNKAKWTDMSKWLASFPVDAWDLAMTGDTAMGATRREFLVNAATYHPRGELSAYPAVDQRGVGNKWEKFHEACATYKKLRVDVNKQAEKTARASRAFDNALKAKCEIENEQYNLLSVAGLMWGGFNMSDLVGKLAKKWGVPERAARKHIDGLLDRERQRFDLFIKAGKEEAVEINALNRMKSEFNEANLKFLQSCVDLLDKWASHHPEVVWANEEPGHHSVIICFYFKTSKGKDITLYQSYSHMYKINVKTGAVIKASDIDNFQLGETGTNGYSANPHFHIYSAWKMGIIKGWVDSLIPTPPHFFFRSS